jgi:hypothetical protein
MPPEVDLLNFAPRVRAPVLLVSGRYDPSFDLEGRRLFLRLLGTPEKDKRLVLVDSGHALMRNPDAIRETLDWRTGTSGRWRPLMPDRLSGFRQEISSFRQDFLPGVPHVGWVSKRR